ncbi:MAG: DUF1064 domain-containing protein [Pelagimonas sp.]|uniref:DUF1064 domain-containing protein n=1 Tax=Pelagimonas sp. TaxID=2073170 RepID=UPI003D6AF1C1
MTDRISAAAFRKEQAQGKNKFGAQKVTVQGIKFDSKREANRWSELRTLERAGQISNLKLQVPIMLEGRDGPMMTRKGRQMRLTVDFSYIDSKTGLTIFEDAKGMPTRDYEVRKAAAAAQGVKVVEV